MASPSVSRSVQYVMPNLRHTAATIVNVGTDEKVNLQVLTDCTNDTFDLSDKYSPDFRMAINSGMFWAINVEHDEITKKVGTWHWCEYVE